ncbi:MAG TPA: hypothetical protein PKA64_23435, partial [Myxococcota bacterium]|nr:hypothetical protein [Myxococcota bacterium]
MALSPHTDTGDSISTTITEDAGIAAVLREVGAWRTDADAQHQMQLDEVDEEVTRLKTAIEDLQRQLTALADFRGDLVRKAERLEVEQARRAHEGIFERLNAQATDLDQRAKAAAATAPRRAQAIAERLATTDMGPALEEYRQFKANSAQLEMLPASYRTAILAHHKQQEEALVALAARIDPGPITIDEPEMELDAVFTVDTSEDQPELVSVVLPVSESIDGRWDEQGDDLQLMVAARVVEGLYRAAAQLGLPKAHAMYGGHRGLLAVELELGAAGTHGDAARKVGEALRAVLDHAPEL